MIKDSKKKAKISTQKKNKNNLTKKIKVKKINMDNFCEENNKLFKKIYLFLTKPKNILILINSLNMLAHPKVQPVLLKEIKNNKENIQKIIQNFRIVSQYYKDNNLVLKSKVGHFILYIEHNISRIKNYNEKNLLNILHKIINYPNLISLLKEIFYILSDYRSCIYYMTPHIKFRDTDKETIDEFVKKFKNNQSMCFSILSGYYPNDKSPWGIYYNGAYACLESLIILNKYYTYPLKALKIEFKYKKKNNKKEILKKLSDIYNIKLNKQDKIINVTSFIIYMKRLKYNMHDVVNSIFKVIYEGSTFKNIDKCYLVNSTKIYDQQKNYYLGVKIFILINNNYITNVNCFENFVI